MKYLKKFESMQPLEDGKKLITKEMVEDVYKPFMDLGYEIRLEDGYYHYTQYSNGMVFFTIVKKVEENVEEEERLSGNGWSAHYFRNMVSLKQEKNIEQNELLEKLKESIEDSNSILGKTTLKYINLNKLDYIEISINDFRK